MRSLGKTFLPLALGLVLAGCLRTEGLLDGVAARPAPATSGSDAKGEPLHLEDYKGQVVLLHFWHMSWLPCRAMLPRERSLVKRFAGKPFIVFGVNAERSAEALRKVEEKESLPWRSWWDGPRGPIAQVWGVDSFPTLFLIDPRGAVRFRHVGVLPESVLAEKIEELLKEASKSEVVKR